MSTRLASWLLSLASVAASALAPAQERILEFASALRVRADSSMEVRETIRVRAEGASIRRGIYRDLPTTYVRSDGSQTRVGFELLYAERDGKLEPHRVEAVGNGVRVYLGDPEVLLAPGEYTYVIAYRTNRQLGFFDQHDELYWNVTGNGWQLPIDVAHAEVELPPGVAADDIELRAYTGPQGTRGEHFTAAVNGGAPRFVTTRSLAPGEGLTIVVMFPKGHVTPPTPAMQRQYAVRDARPVLYGVGGLALLLAYYVGIWFLVGRDPPGRVIVPIYEPPAGQSPASMRYLTQLKYDDRTFGAAILSLAVKGQLAIEESRGIILGFGRRITLARQRGAEPGTLSDDERVLLEALFAEGDRLTLENDNHQVVNDAKKLHRRALQRGYTPSFVRINGAWHALGIAFSLLVGFVALILPAGVHVPPEWYLVDPLGHVTVGAVAVGLIANGVFGRLLKAPTITGRAAIDRIRGYALYLGVAEGTELANMQGPPLTPSLFEANLPAALALDVEQRWAERFSEQLAVQAPSYSPSWYQGERWNVHEVPSFSSSLGSSLDKAISSASSAPGSSSGGGSSGSSGGGGGGGGGGGW